MPNVPDGARPLVAIKKKALESARRVPISTAKTTGGFIRIPGGVVQHILLDTAILE